MPKTVYPNYLTFYEKAVVPHKAKSNDALRLDGMSSGGNREIFGFFEYAGSTWKVHSDTHFSELEKTYNFLKEGIDPFTQKATTRGGNCLELKKEFANRPKYLYIYLV